MVLETDREEHTEIEHNRYSQFLSQHNKSFLDVFLSQNGELWPVSDLGDGDDGAPAGGWRGAQLR